MYRTPVAGIMTPVTVPGLPWLVRFGSCTDTVVTVPVVMTRRTQPPPGMMSLAEMVSLAVGVNGPGVVPVVTTDWAALSVMTVLSGRSAQSVRDDEVHDGGAG